MLDSGELYFQTQVRPLFNTCAMYFIYQAVFVCHNHILQHIPFRFHEHDKDSSH